LKAPKEPKTLSTETNLQRHTEPWNSSSSVLYRGLIGRNCRLVS
ncbi:hypothetical protein T09_2830, partial [Trichinella sp. T9]